MVGLFIPASHAFKLKFFYNYSFSWILEFILVTYVKIGPLNWLQVSRSIGDVYLKHAKYCREPINGKFRVSEPINMPILLATPSILTHPLHPNDSFLIFASDGLWEHLSNEKAVQIVQSHPRKVSSMHHNITPFLHIEFTF